MRANVYTVSQVNGYIKRLLEKDVFLQDIFVEAEISNFKPHSSGHWYFTLKDEGAAINAVMFRSSAAGVKFMPENGMRVLVYGRVSLYEKTGQYQLYVNLMEPAGKGALFIAFEQLKARLSAEGLFDDIYKKPISAYPKCIAVITSPTGAAIRDVLQITKRRNPQVKIVVVPVMVQGESAAEEIANAIKNVNVWGQADTIIVGRGGGSLEDLWAFNEEVVARAIFASKIPVISAVGHETDFTISDFVADLRASTPSAAAELAVPSMEQIEKSFKTDVKRLIYLFENKYNNLKNNYKSIVNSYAFKNYSQTVYENQMYGEQLYKRLDRSMLSLIDNKRMLLSKATVTMENISPLNVLSRGYSLVYKNEKLVSDMQQLDEGDKIKIRLSRGSVNAVVEGTEE